MPGARRAAVGPPFPPGRGRRRDPASSRGQVDPAPASPRALGPAVRAEPCDWRALPASAPPLIRGGARSPAQPQRPRSAPAARAGGRRGGRCRRRRRGPSAAAWRPRTKGRRWSRCCPRYGCRSAAPVRGGVATRPRGEGGAGGRLPARLRRVGVVVSAPVSRCVGKQVGWLRCRAMRRRGGVWALGAGAVCVCACVSVCPAGASTLPSGSPRLGHPLRLGIPSLRITRPPTSPFSGSPCSPAVGQRWGDCTCEQLRGDPAAGLGLSPQVPGPPCLWTAGESAELRHQHGRGSLPPDPALCFVTRCRSFFCSDVEPGIRGVIVAWGLHGAPLPLSTAWLHSCGWAAFPRRVRKGQLVEDFLRCWISGDPLPARSPPNTGFADTCKV